VETLNEAGVAKGSGKTIVASCPHCFNTIAREYPQLGGNYEVIHHTQLLSRLIQQGKLTPAGEVKEKITYHDPCFLGRHNKVYTPPRQIIDAVPGTTAEEMHRCKNRGFCCGAGGARMWMEERIGKRINTERIDEALALNPDSISTACPYCLVMLGDAVAAKKSAGQAKESLEVIDVAQLLARSVALQRPPANGADGGAPETGVDAAPPGDVTSAGEGEPTTTATDSSGNGSTGPGTPGASPVSSAVTSPGASPASSAGASPGASSAGTSGADGASTQAGAPGATTGGPDTAGGTTAQAADGEAGPGLVEDRAPTFRAGDGEASADTPDASGVAPSDVMGDKSPGDGDKSPGDKAPGRASSDPEPPSGPAAQES
jgi:hypothetical protein